MKAPPEPAYKPRKTPIQERSALTVEAIAEATIQVLLSDGIDRLTTTRVAERAGVSVGTLYQYFPNKQSLLFALLEKHMAAVASAVEAACVEASGKPLHELLRHVVERYVEAKIARSDVSTALYRISADIGGPAIVQRTVRRIRTVLEAAIVSAPDVVSPPAAFAVQTMYAAMAGATATVLETGAPPAAVTGLRVHLTLLCQSYMEAASRLRVAPGMARLQ